MSTMFYRESAILARLSFSKQPLSFIHISVSLSICPQTYNFLYFFFRSKHWADINQTWHKSSFDRIVLKGHSLMQVDIFLKFENHWQLLAHLSHRLKWAFLIKICHKLFTFSSSSPEPLGQFQPKLAQSILGWRGFKFVQMKDPALFQGEIIVK